MKNLLVYIHPRKSFKRDYRREMEFLAKVQIDNSLAFGWKQEDIMIVTNFPYEYRGIKAIEVPDTTFSPKRKTVSKINAILALFDMGLIKDELFWFHDFDAFQNAPLGEVDLGDKELALTHTSVNDSRLSTGVMFFSKKSEALLRAMQAKCVEFSTNEEMALRILIRNDPTIKDRLLILNISHNFAIRKRNVVGQYEEADEPIKVLHFHPFDNRLCSEEVGKTSLDVVYGNNSFGKRLIGDGLDSILRQNDLIYK